MNRKKAIIISFGIAIFALFIAYSYLNDIERKIIGSVTPVKVVVAVKDIPEGTHLDESHVTLKEIPVKSLQPGANLDKISNVLDKVVLIPVLKGTQILDTMFLVAEKEGIAAKIPPKMRAVSIAATEVSAASGLIQPGDFVDVIATVQKSNKKQMDGMGMGALMVMEDVISIYCLQNVRVLSINRTASKLDSLKSMNLSQMNVIGNLMSRSKKNKNDYEELSTLTLCLSPNDAMKAVQAQKTGRLDVLLRSKWNKGDIVRIETMKTRDWGVPPGPIVSPMIDRESY